MDIMPPTTDPLNTVTYYSYCTTPIGKLLLTACNNALTGLYIEGATNFPTLSINWLHQEQLPLFATLTQQLKEYFAAKRACFAINYALIGNPLEQDVWQKLSNIPYGQTLSYKAFAALTIYPKAIRTVATAIARNPLSLILPCHRVIRSNGTLGGYAGGIERKKNLLLLEKATVALTSD